MRLRQVAFMAREIAPGAEQLEAVVGLKVGFRDPGVGYFGLANVVMPVGGEFLEVLEPIRDDASGARYLARRGGDAGYMVILQVADAEAERARALGLGARVVDVATGDERDRSHGGSAAILRACAPEGALRTLVVRVAVTAGTLDVVVGERIAR